MQPVSTIWKLLETIAGTPDAVPLATVAEADDPVQLTATEPLITSRNDGDIAETLPPLVTTADPAEAVATQPALAAKAIAIGTTVALPFLSMIFFLRWNMRRQ